MNHRTLQKSSERGFTLIELLVVVLIIGILSAIAVPQYFKVVEKGKSAEAFQWISGLKGAQERYLAKNGNYATDTLATTLDVNLGNLSKYTGSAVTVTTTPSWSITLTRKTPAPAVYGTYVITYTAPPGNFTCSQTDCSADLIPQ